MRVCRKYGRKRGGKIGKEKENRHNRGRITRAIILRVRGRPLPTSSFSVSSSFYSSSTSSLATPAALVSVHLLVSCLARFSSIFLPRRRRSSQSRTSRRCVIRIFFAQMTPDPPLGSRRDPTDDDRGANTSPPPSPSPPPPPPSSSPP